MASQDRTYRSVVIIEHFLLLPPSFKLLESQIWVPRRNILDFIINKFEFGKMALK
jgi:hypothetical protein